MPLIFQHRRIDALLNSWHEDLGPDMTAYRNHVYRVLNLSVAQIRSEESETIDVLAIAAAFHDIGIWTDHTFDYIEPSIKRAETWLINEGLSSWFGAVSDMIRWHHKITPWSGPEVDLVEGFRRADWLDVCLFALPTRLPRPFLGEVLSAFPRAGFHSILTKMTLRWASRHPFKPLPMFRW